mmetsp:Transcript_97873/g.204083  ORF Transcript_97873/g.204083 Transcript_97873/m.204083 type:complete len:302 (-) Transcript_97873:83-988(-)
MTATTSKPLLTAVKAAGRSWVVPLALFWDGHSAKEEQARWQKRKLDSIVIPCFALWYWVQARFVSPPGAAIIDVAPPSSLTFYLRVFLAIAAVWVLVVHVWAFPAPAEDQDAFTVQRHVGRWAYLTRHCICMQACHLSFSCLAWAIPSLAVLTDAMVVWVGALGWFVTIQYFILVVPSKPFQQDCDLWAGRGVQFKEVGAVVHVPAMFLALADLLLSRSAAGLREAFDFKNTYELVLLYTLFYLAVIVLNHQVTDKWPYGFMNDLGVDPRKWAKFVFGQVAVLCAFTTANWLLLLAKISLL